MKPYRQPKAVINLTVNMPEEVAADLPVLCDDQDSDSLVRMLQRTEQETGLESAQIAELSALTSGFQDCFADKPGSP